MIATDTYPELDEAHVEALFGAARRAVEDALQLVVVLSAGGSERRVSDEHPILRFLPRKYLPRYDLHFARRFASAVVTVTWKLSEPIHVYSLASTAEEDRK